jgi:uncharacterized protein (DUF1697 family)
MSELKATCVAAGFLKVQTYIASGNVVFESKLSEAKVKRELEVRLRPIGVVVRTSDEMAAVLAANPFPRAEPNRTVVFFLDEPPKANALGDISGVNGEELRLGKREIFVHYPNGQGQSKLKIPAAKTGTGRNMNTVAKLVDLSSPLAQSLGRTESGGAAGRKPAGH